MKQTLLFTLIFFLAACTSAPQVTPPSPALGEGPGVRETPPPTDTPAPTPTPVAVDGIATVDGIHYIFDESAQEWQALPELDAEFERVLVTEDERIVALDENGAEVYTLDMATGEWVKLESEAMAQAKADFEKYGYDYSNLEFGENEQGQAVATDPETGEVVYEDGKYSLNFVVEQASQLDLMPTDIEPREDILQSTGQYFVASGTQAFEYFGPLYKEKVKIMLMEDYGYQPEELGKVSGIEVMLNPDINAWGRRSYIDKKDPDTEKFFYYQLRDGVVHLVPLL